MPPAMQLALLLAGRPSAVYADGYLPAWLAVCKQLRIKMAPIERQLAKADQLAKKKGKLPAASPRRAAAKKGGRR